MIPLKFFVILGYQKCDLKVTKRVTIEKLGSISATLSCLVYPPLLSRTAAG